jgi:hypothetical protein
MLSDPTENQMIQIHHSQLSSGHVKSGSKGTDDRLAVLGAIRRCFVGVIERLVRIEIQVQLENRHQQTLAKRRMAAQEKRGQGKKMKEVLENAGHIR